MKNGAIKIMKNTSFKPILCYLALPLYIPPSPFPPTLSQPALSVYSLLRPISESSIFASLMLSKPSNDKLSCSCWVADVLKIQNNIKIIEKIFQRQNKS